MHWYNKRACFVKTATGAPLSRLRMNTKRTTIYKEALKDYEHKFSQRNHR